MSSIDAVLNAATLSTVLHLLLVVVLAVVLNRFFRALTNLLIKPAPSQSRSELQREQQTRVLAGILYGVASKVVWLIAILTALQAIGISPVPALVLGGVAGLALGLGAQNVIRDSISGFYIVLEDQYAPGDTVQIADTTGRVEHLTLRRTVLRDSRGALVTIANGDVRAVANLSRDWSQSFVDIGLAPDMALDKPLAALETAAAELRGDASWSQALLDGPRILGVQSYDRNAIVVRLQVRTAPTRQDEVTRELRRRILIEFQKRGVAAAGLSPLELSNPKTVESTQPVSPQ